MSQNEEKKSVKFWKELKKIRCFLSNYKNSFLLVYIGLFTWIAYEKQLVEIYNDTVVSLLSKVNDSFFFMIFAYISMALLACHLIYISCNARNRFLDAVPRMILIVSLAVVYFVYREGDRYTYYPSEYEIKYLDVLFAIISLYAICQLCLNYSAKRIYRDPQENDFIPGQAVNKEDEDALQIYNSAKNVAERLDKIPPKVSFSIGINSSWGDGKSSYLSFICQNIDKEKYIIINFNPTESKDANLIQIDFFEKIKTELQDYNGELSTLIDNYMKAIGIIDESKFMTKVRELKDAFYDIDELEKLRIALSKINKRLVVIIDDIDRLTPEEALKTIKIIRYAAYRISDIIFITAYDRNCINQFTKNKAGEDMSLFWDKFFDMEIQLPYRSHEYIISYMSEQLHKWHHEYDVVYYAKIMQDLGDGFQLFIKNLRDAKRFLNAFYMEYLSLKHEIVIRDLFYVQLLKYRYIDVYYALRAKKFLDENYSQIVGDIHFIGRYVLKEKFEEELNSKILKSTDEAAIIELLKLLFSQDSHLKEQRPICNCSSFNSYFMGRTVNILTLKDIESLFAKSESEMILTIDGWSKPDSLNELIEYFMSCNVLNYRDKKDFELHAKGSFYLLKYVESLYYYRYLTGYFNKNEISLVAKKYYNGDEKQYKHFFVNLFESDSHGQYIYNTFFRQILIDLSVTNNNAEDSWIFNKNEFLEFTRKSLTYYLENDISKEEENDLSKGLELLSCCVQKANLSTPPILDAEACQAMKEYIVRQPEEYISHLVQCQQDQKGIVLISPESHYESIFGSKDEFEAFITKKELNQVDKIKLVRDFWEVYKSSNYLPINCQENPVDYEKIGNYLSNLAKVINSMFQK